MFYGGIAAGVVLASRSATNANLQPYLFGSILTATADDVWTVIALGAVIVVAVGFTGRALLAVVLDEDSARVAGVPARALNAMLAVLTAVTVVMAMRIVGVLLIAALMVLPVATSRLLARSFRGTLIGAVGVGVLSAVLGLFAARQWALAAGGAIVLVAAALFAIASIIAGARRAGAQADSLLAGPHLGAMAHIVTRIQVGDYDTWKALFDLDGPTCREATGHRVLRNVDDPNEVYIFIDFASASRRVGRDRLVASGVLDRFPTTPDPWSSRPRRTSPAPADRRPGSLAWPACRRCSRASSTARSPASSCGATSSASCSSRSTRCIPATPWSSPAPRSTTGSISTPTLAAHLFQVAQTIGQAQHGRVRRPPHRRDDRRRRGPPRPPARRAVRFGVGAVVRARRSEPARGLARRRGGRDPRRAARPLDAARAEHVSE